MMKQYLIILFGGLILLSFSACRQKIQEHEYYIITTENSTDFSNKHDTNDNSLPLPPPPPKPHRIVGSLYSNLVLLLDSSDVVYLYQTEVIKKKNNSCNLKNEECQNFIGLKPEHLIKFDKRNFINFINDNNDIFHFDTTSELLRLIFIASNKDTITNPVFYDFIKLTISKNNRSKVIYEVRMTTEEENYVMFCKKNHISYNPSNFEWSNNSLVSKYKLFTKQYDSIENTMFDYIVRAQTTYKIDTIKMEKRIQ